MMMKVLFSQANYNQLYKFKLENSTISTSDDN